MSLNHSPRIVTDGMVFYYDMGNMKKSWIGRPTTNSINAVTSAISRYNNPGFSGAVTNTGLTYKGCPIYELTFIAQDSTFISRLASTEGFGALHTMGIPLLPGTTYLASIYFRTEHPLQNSVSQGFSNGYSNITGWNQNGTTSARYQEDGWTRLYTQYNNTVNGYSSRTNSFQTNFTVNTTSTQNVDLTFTVPSNGSGISDFTYLHAIVSAGPSIASNGGLTGLSIVDHGLDTTSFTKLAWPSNIKLKSTDLPFNYFVRVSVPSTGGVNTTISLRANFGGYYTALTDSKFWKATFDTTNVAVGQPIKTYWCCPMIEQHDTVYPSTFVNGTRSNTQAIVDLTNTSTVTATSLTYASSGAFNFNGSSDYLSTSTAVNAKTIMAWCKLSTAAGGDYVIYGLDANGADNWLSINTNKAYVYATQSSDVNNFGVTGTTTLNTTNYYQICCTIDTNTVKVYVNGVEEASSTQAFTIGSWNTAPTIGRRGSLAQKYFPGTIDVVSVYNRVLSAAEIKQNFNALRSRYGI